MPLDSHDHVNTPNEDSNIWRYYDTSQFLWVLQNRQLHLSRMDQLDDPFEGYSPTKNLQRDLESMKRYEDHLEETFENLDLAPPDLPSPESRAARKYEYFRNLSLVNCWSKDESDSASMWNSFISNGDGVAIQTTVENLRKALDDMNDHPYLIGEMAYFDYFEDFLQTTNQFEFLFSKPRQYEFEREVRLLYYWPNQEELIEEMGAELVDNTGINFAPPSINMGVDIDRLIDTLYISPYGPDWSTVEYWNDLLDRYDVDAECHVSYLEMEPSSVLE